MTTRTVIRALCLTAFLVMVSPVTAALAYDGGKAAAYADQYWSSYNSTYPSFAHKGGDCSNFVSQSLYAGGIGMRTSPLTGLNAWYMVRSGGNWSWSVSWINAQDNSVFLLQHLSGVTKVQDLMSPAPGQTAPTNATQGDVVFYDWNNDGTFDHEAIITAGETVNGTTQWDLVDAHTNNRYHAYWTLAQYNTSYKTTHIVVYHIASSVS